MILVVIATLILISVLTLWAMVTYCTPSVETFFDVSAPYISVESVVRQANTGDVVLLGGDTIGERGIRWITGCPFSHVAMVIRERGEVYLWEADLGQKTRDGPRVIRLIDKLALYSGFRVGGWKQLRNDQRPSEQDVLRCVEKMKTLEFDNVMLTWFVTYVYPLYALFKSPRTVFCTELIIMTMQYLNMMSRDKIPAAFSPADFFHSRFEVVFRPIRLFRF